MARLHSAPASGYGRPHMRNLFVAAVVAASLVPLGCGGGSSGSTKTPKGTVELFRSKVDDGDWKGACADLSSLGKSELAGRLHLIGTDEADAYGKVKDCAATLKKHAGTLRKSLEGTEPQKTRKLRSNSALVSSKHGDWAVDTVEKPGVWHVSALPNGG